MLLIYVIILGLMVGSFLNCLIWRLYQGESILGRSYCPRCRQKINWFDNIPVLSFIILRGRCRACQQKIAWQYPLVELATAGLFLLTWQKLGADQWLAFKLGQAWLLVIVAVVVFVFDSRWQLIPLQLIWPASVLALLMSLAAGTSLITLAWSILPLAGTFLLIYLVSRKRGMGEGDIWLGLYLGLSLANWQLSLLTLFLASGLGALGGLIWRLSLKKPRGARIAFGPFLVGGALVAWLWGELIISQYLELLLGGSLLIF